MSAPLNMVATGVKRPRIALVIGSGALKCAAAFGVVKVLQEHHIPIDMVIGCSGGAFCGAWLAAGGGDIDDAIQTFTDGWRDSFGEIDYWSLASALLPRWFGFNGSAHLVKDRRINAGIAAFAGDRLIEDLPIPLHLVATDFVTGDVVKLSTGRIADGIRASIGMPLILAPWELNGRRLVDGGVSNPLPVDIAVKEGADVVIAVGFEDTLNASFSSALGMVVQLTSLLVNNLYRSQFAFFNLTHDAETLIIVPQFDRDVGLNDTHLIPYLVERGAAATEAEMPYLHRLLFASSSVPIMVAQ
jgi:NTE family protein